MNTQSNNTETKYYNVAVNGERRVSPLTRFKFDLLAEKAKLEVIVVLQRRTTPSSLDINSLVNRVQAIDNAVMLLNEALQEGGK